MNKKRIAVLTSGGDAPGMNAAIRAVVRKALYCNLDVIGVYRGYQGLIHQDFIPMQMDTVASIINSGGTMLKSARSEQFMTVEGFNLAVRNLRKNNVDALVVIGGDGSMAGARKLSDAGIATIVIPATIDKDMPGTDYTLGFDTALNTILEAVYKIRDTASSHDRVAIIEVMGRRAGHLALMAGVACGAEAILIPEIPFDIRDICKGLIETYNRGKRYSIIMVAEGVGTGFSIAEQIKMHTEFSPHVTVLGYLQRGGFPTAMDNITGSRMGNLAVECIIREQADCLVAVQQDRVVAISYEEVERYTAAIDQPLHGLARILAM